MEKRKPSETCPKQYCLIDHANKQKELARFTPYEFWTSQVKRRNFRKPEGAVNAKAGSR